MSDKTRIRSIALAAPLLVWGVGIAAPTHAAPADDCLVAPNAATPKGGHWYYHMDRAKHRKCWYLVTPDGSQPNTTVQATSATTPATHAKASNKTSNKTSKKPAAARGSTAKPTDHAASASPLPAAKVQSTPQPVPARGATAFEPVQKGVETKSAAPSFPEAPAAQTSESFQNGAPAGAAAPAVPIIWPDLRPVDTIKIRKPNSDPSDAVADPVPSAGVVQTPRAPADTARTAAPAKPARTVEMASSSAVTPVEMALAAALALAVAGLLYHLVRTLAARRGGQIKIEHVPPVWADMRPQRAWPDDRRQPAPFGGDRQAQEYALDGLRRQKHVRDEPRQQRHVNEREQFVEESDVSLVPAASDAGVRRPLRTAITDEYGIRRSQRAAAVSQNKALDAGQNKAPRKDSGAHADDTANVHDNNLSQLIRDLDQLLQTRKQA